MYLLCNCNLQISCVSSSTELRNRVKFPSYFQLLSAEETLAFAYYGVIKEYEWTRVALIVQNENLFTGVSYEAILMLVCSNVQWTPFKQPPSKKRHRAVD